MATREQEEALAEAVREAARKLNKAVMDAGDYGIEVYLGVRQTPVSAGRPHGEIVEVTMSRRL